jgi:hypothetical protein
MNCQFESAMGQHAKEEQSATKNENRLSFDFCELSADHLLESTPVSYKNDRAKSPPFPFTKDRTLKQD